MAILKAYKVNSYRRICDVCGRPRQIEDIRFADNVAICSIHPTYRTAQQLNQLNARVRPPRILPVPQPKPLAPVDTWTAEESQIFNLVCRVAPFDIENVTVGSGAITGAKTLPALTWALVYLTGVLLENKRPAAWYAAARAKAIALASTLIATQTPETDLSAFTGGFAPGLLNPASPSVYKAADTGLGLLGLARLYQITGDETYLRTAKLAAGFVITLQASNLALFDTQHAYGPPENGYDVDNGQYQTVYFPGDLVCYWGLSVLKAITGDITIGPTAAGLAVFSSNPSRLISASMAQMRAFWATGALGINGFSAATPRANFISTVSPGWGSTTVTTSDWAAGLCALAEVEGVTSQVSDLWTFLRSLTSTSLDTTLAPPTQFSASAATTSVYDWASAGLLSPITTSKDRAKVKTVKDTISVPQPRFNERTPRSGDYLYLGPLGLSGAALQPITSGASTRERSVVRASQVGQLYREQPQGFTGRGH